VRYFSCISHSTTVLTTIETAAKTANSFHSNLQFINHLIITTNNNLTAKAIGIPIICVTDGFFMLKRQQ